MPNVRWDMDMEEMPAAMTPLGVVQTAHRALMSREAPVFRVTYEDGRIFDVDVAANTIEEVTTPVEFPLTGIERLAQARGCKVLGAVLVQRGGSIHVVLCEREHPLQKYVVWYYIQYPGEAGHFEAGDYEEHLTDAFRKFTDRVRQQANGYLLQGA